MTILEILEYNIEEWEGLLKDLTFPSTLIPLTVGWLAVVFHLVRKRLNFFIIP